ncbi:MAG TPA: alpha/beta hydrolase [Alphaproteobacteria bacterium]|nr:alpha/beta hydrolase [Alphaproteobacteria bacterium]
MPHADNNGVKLYFEEAGTGTPIVFLHEFAADFRSWEMQLRFFSRTHRAVAVNARGYPPSDVPPDPAAYGYELFVDDIRAVLDHLGEDRAYIVGLSMGAYAALHFGLTHPGRALGLVLAGGGSGSPKAEQAAFKEQADALAQRFLKDGMPAVAPTLSLSPTRVQLQNKDPRGWAEFNGYLEEHSTEGSALTVRNYQGGRPSLYDFEAALSKLTVPVLLAVGDEDDPCLEVNLFLKRTIPASGLWVVPKTGHGINLEEPAAFNNALQGFFSAVENGKWTARDPRSQGSGAFSVRQDA